MPRTLLSLILRDKKENIPFLAGLIGISVIFSINYMNMAYEIFPGEKCVADIFKIVNRADFISYITIPFMIYYTFITRDEYNVMYVVKRKSKKEIWLLGLFNDIKISFVYTIALFVIEPVIAKCLWGKVEIINWTSYISNYSIASNGLTSDIGLLSVIFKAYVLLYAKIMVCLFFSRLITWMTNIRLLSIVILVISAVVDYRPVKGTEGIFWNKFKYSNLDWGINVFSSYKCIMWLLLITVIIVIAGLLYSEHREFVDDEHI